MPQRRGKIGVSITWKLLAWYLLMLSIFSGTILAMFLYIHRLTTVSDGIVNENTKISAITKKMLEDLLALEAREKTYQVLRKPSYIREYVSVQESFEMNLRKMSGWLEGMEDSAPLKRLSMDYQAYLRSRDDDHTGEGLLLGPWVPESQRENWIDWVNEGRIANQFEIDAAMMGLYSEGQRAIQWGLLGLGASIFFGLLGALFILYSMNRPLRELRKGIRSISRRGLRRPIRILTKDEFGQLAQAFNEMAVRLRREERMRSEFISMLSHEIRTPLASIRESVNLMAEEVTGPVNEPQRRLLEIASGEMRRLTDQLDQLMQVARLEAGVLDFHFLATDPATLVSSCLHRLAPIAEARGVKIRSEVPAKVPSMKGDPEHLQQVLLNLLGNAIKFSPRGSVVMVRVEEEDGAPLLKFSVSDQGPGIPEYEQPLIFQKYYRASASRDQVDGLGLGLSIVEYILEAHGGRIWLESRLGRGSTFFFTLPMAKEA